MKSARYLEREQSGRPPIPIIAVKFDREDTIRPIIFTDRQLDVSIISGYVATGRDFVGCTRSSTWVVGGRLQLSAAIGGGYAASGTCTSKAIDLGYAPRFRTVNFGSVKPSGSAVTLELRTSATPTFSGAWVAYSNGGDISGLGGARYLQYKFTLTGDTTTTPTVAKLSVVYETQEHFPIVTSFGTVDAELSLGEGLHVPSWSPTFDNTDNRFAQIASLYPLDGMECSAVLGYEDSGASDFQVLATGLIGNISMEGDSGTFDVSIGKTETGRRVPRLRTNDLNKITNEYLPAHFGSVDNSISASLCKPTTDLIKRINIDAVFEDAADESWVLSWSPTVMAFTITGSVTGEINKTVGINHMTEIRNDTDDLLFRIAVKTERSTDQYRLAVGDGGTFTVAREVEGRTVRIDQGTETTDLLQTYCLNQWPSTIDGIYDDDGLIDPAEYDAYPALSVYGHRIAAIVFKSTNTPTGTVKWTGHGLRLDGNDVDNPAQVIRALTLYNPAGTPRLYEDWFDNNSYLDFLAYCDEKEIKVKGELPESDQTLTEVINSICQYIADLDLSTGTIRLVTLRGDAPATTELIDVIPESELAGPVGFKSTDAGWIQNNLTPIEWRKFGGNKLLITSAIEPRIKNDASIAHYGYWIGHGKSIKTPIRYDYISTYEGAITVAKNWLDLHGTPKYFLTINLENLKHAAVELGSRAYGLTDSRTPNRYLKTVGVVEQPGTIVAKSIDLDAGRVTLTLLVWPESVPTADAADQVMTWDTTGLGWGAVWGI